MHSFLTLPRSFKLKDYQSTKNCRYYVVTDKIELDAEMKIKFIFKFNCKAH